MNGTPQKERRHDGTLNRSRAEAVKAESEGSAQPEAHTCPVCGTKFFATADREFCPVCILRRAFGAEATATGEPGSASGSVASPGDKEGTPQVRRIRAYEVMLGEEGGPIELGRGAMGVTYKALDVDLRCGDLEGH